MITPSDIQNFLNQYNYDIRLSNNGRWLDQKVTYDVSSMIADCVLNYTSSNNNSEFTANDIWHSQYASDNIIAIFNKPDPNSKRVQNEYDKFFSQPLLFLASSGVLHLNKKGNRNYYTVNNRDMLEYIASREYNSFIFTHMYIEKVMKDSGLWSHFENFFARQDKESYYHLKETFSNFLKKYTPIKRDYEPNRIFTKVINPLA
ncbi:TPA: restriction endonuclease, partial [Streptococcus suis]|nr:restriction endonuclease [Streptococcus suis]